MTLTLCCAGLALMLLLAAIVGAVLLHYAPVEQWPGQYG